MNPDELGFDPDDLEIPDNLIPEFPELPFRATIETQTILLEIMPRETWEAIGQIAYHMHQERYAEAAILRKRFGISGGGG